MGFAWGILLPHHKNIPESFDTQHIQQGLQTAG
jgi:hypothetical protein